MSPEYQVQNKKYVLVIAHPDDESMFFVFILTILNLQVPTLQTLQEKGADIYILCLSCGNADGFGHQRIKELRSLGKYIHLVEDHMTILDDPALQDGMDSEWNIQHGSFLVTEFVNKFDIENVITFDEDGISNHPNHIATYKIVLEAMTLLPENVNLYTLESLPIYRKFSGPLEMIVTLWKGMGNYIINLNPYPYKALYYMSFHKSQNVWFRKLFTVFSSYAYVNKLNKI